MRQFIVLSILLGIMFLLKTMSVDTDNGVSYFLASTGFVLLAAFTAAELANKIQLPKVTGFILAGLILGPSMLNVLNESVVNDLNMFRTLALGLIALNAGLELHVQSLKRISKNLLLTISLKIIFLFILVGGVVLFAQQQWSVIPVSILEDNPTYLLPIALVISALCIGTSPAIALAVTQEMGAKGRLVDLTLGMAVAKDIVVVITLAIVIGFSKLLISDVSGINDAAGTMTLITNVSTELFFSILLGTFLGVLLILYLKYIGRELLLFVSATILGAAVVCQTLHLELLLVFIASGFIVRNFSSCEELLHKPIQRVSLPVFVVFFTNAGADLNLSQIQQVGLVVFAVFMLRGIAFYLSTKISSKILNESEIIKDKSWLCYMPQAGVTLGLVGVAAAQLPHISKTIELIGLGLVALNLILGPILLRLGLKSKKVIGTPEVKLNFDESDILSPKHDYIKYLDNIQNGHLKKRTIEIISYLESSYNEKVVQRLLPIIRSIIEENKIENFKNNPNDLSFLTTFDNQMEKLRQKSQNFLRFYESIDSYLLQQSPVVSVNFEKNNYKIIPSDTLKNKLNKILLRLKILLSSKEKPLMRDVPLQSLLRFFILEELSNFTWTIINNWNRELYLVAEDFRKSIVGDNTNLNDFWNLSHERLNKCIEFSVKDLQFIFSKISEPICISLNEVGGVHLKSIDVRYSTIEPKVADKIKLAEYDSKLWDEKYQFVHNTLYAHFTTGQIQSILKQIMQTSCLNPIGKIKDLFIGACEKQIEYSKSFTQSHLTELTLTSESKLKELHNDFKIYKIQITKELKACEDFLSSYRLLNRDLNLAMKERVQDLNHAVEILSEDTLGRLAFRPQDLDVIRVDLDNNFHESVLIEVLPSIESKMEKLNALVESSIIEFEDSINVLDYALETILDVSLELRKDNLLTAVERVEDRINQVKTEVLKDILESEETIQKLISESSLELWKGLHRTSVVRTATSRIKGVRGSLVSKLEDIERSILKMNDSIVHSLKSIFKIFRDHEETSIIRSRIQKDKLDSLVIRNFIQSHYQVDFKYDLPRLYQRLFSLDPLQDRRFMSAHKDIVEKLIGHYGDIEMGGRKILITGESGMGKTSLLNVCQMDFINANILRIDLDSRNSKKSIFDHLALVLKCETSVNAILRSLKSRNIIIMIDNLDHWWDMHAYDGMDKFFEVVVRSTKNISWIVTIKETNLKVFNEVFEVKSVFNEVYGLEPLNSDNFKKMIFDRHKLSGLEVEFVSSLGFESLKQIWKSGDEQIFYRTLLEKCRGNLRMGLFLWLKSIESFSEEKIKISLHRGMIGSFDFIEYLPENSKFLLKEIVRFGPRSISQLRDSLSWDSKVLRRELYSLESSCLVERRDRDGRVFEISKDLRFPISDQLTRMNWI